jgi:hypothetical protein
MWVSIRSFETLTVLLTGPFIYSTFLYDLSAFALNKILSLMKLKWHFLLGETSFGSFEAIDVHSEGHCGSNRDVIHTERSWDEDLAHVYICPGVPNETLFPMWCTTINQSPLGSARYRVPLGPNPWKTSVFPHLTMWCSLPYYHQLLSNAFSSHYTNWAMRWCDTALEIPLPF